MKRRQLLRLAVAGGLWLVLTGHSPYRQWEVYRKVRLIVLVNGEDAASVQLGQALAGLLAEHVPESRAMMSRARDIIDLVRLIASKQLDTALMRDEDASSGVPRRRPIRRQRECAAPHARAVRLISFRLPR